MGMRVSLAFFFFFFLYEGQGEKQPKMFEQVLGRTYRKCGGSTAPHFFFFFGRRSEPGTGAGPRLEKMCRDCWLQLIDGNEGVAGLFFFFFFLYEGQGEKQPKMFEQVLGRTYRKCGGSTAPHFFFFFGRRSEPGTGAGPRLEKMCRDCWLQLIDGNEGVAGLFFFFFSVRGARRKTTKDVRTSAGPNLQKMWRVDRTALFFFFWKKVWTWNRCWASLRENV